MTRSFGSVTAIGRAPSDVECWLGGADWEVAPGSFEPERVAGTDLGGDGLLVAEEEIVAFSRSETIAAADLLADRDPGDETAPSGTETTPLLTEVLAAAGLLAVDHGSRNRAAVLGGPSSGATGPFPCRPSGCWCRCRRRRPSLRSRRPPPTSSTVRRSTVD